MTRRVLGAVGLALALSLLAACSLAVAAVPEGPRLSFVRLSLEPPRIDLVTLGPQGDVPKRLVPWSRRGLSAAPLDSHSWSADGGTLAFIGEAGRRKNRIYVVGPDGGRPTLLPGTENASHPVISPDGRTIAFGRLRIKKEKGARRGRAARPVFSASVWLVDVDGGKPRRLTPWRDGLVVFPSSFSPDGSVLAVWRERAGRAPEARALSMVGGPPTLIAANASEPVYSPDGSRVAFVRPQKRGGKKAPPLFIPGTDVYVTDGVTTTRLTRTPGRPEAWPGWDPSGQRLIFTQFAAKISFAALLGISNAVIEVNADGSCRHRLLFERQTAFYGTSWQPGSGRATGPILC